MNFNKYIVLILLTGFLWNCSGTKSLESRILIEKQLEYVRKLVEGRSFKFLAESAYPLQTYDVMQVTNALLVNTGNTGSRISLVGNGDYLKIDNDLAVAELPYFGEIRMGTTLNPLKPGVNFNSKPLDFEVIENKKKKFITVKFDIRSDTEVFDVTLRINPNKNAVAYVSSISRTVIRYDGIISELEKEEVNSNQ